MSNSVRPHRRQPTRLPRPWDSPGKNTGVGCHFLLQCMKVKTESEVGQSCPTLSDPMDCSRPGSSVHGIFPGKNTGVPHCTWNPLDHRSNLCPLHWQVYSCPLYHQGSSYLRTFKDHMYSGSFFHLMAGQLQGLQACRMQPSTCPNRSPSLCRNPHIPRGVKVE